MLNTSHEQQGPPVHVGEGFGIQVHLSVAGMNPEAHLMALQLHFLVERSYEQHGSPPQSFDSITQLQSSPRMYPSGHVIGGQTQAHLDCSQTRLLRQATFLHSVGLGLPDPLPDRK